jgi:2-polyprenyl-6-methoxyphenol hydroxylase-like FAD-dependent oxidoreductase
MIAAAMQSRRPVDAQRWLMSLIDDRLNELMMRAPHGPVRFFRGLPARLRRPSGAGWALVGDAGWWKDPLATHGITSALRDAELLATAVMAGRASERAGAIALAGYQAERDRTASAMHPVVDRLASHEWDLEEVRQLLRELASAMANEVEAIRGSDIAPAYIA